MNIKRHILSAGQREDGQKDNNKCLHYSAKMGLIYAFGVTNFWKGWKNFILRDQLPAPISQYCGAFWAK